MRRNNNGTLERVSPCGIRIHSNKALSDLYPSTLIRDLTCHFSTLLSQSINNCDFYTIESQDKRLMDLLSYEHYDFLEYEFDKVLSSIMYNLIFANKTFLEIAFFKNEKGEIEGISLIPFDAIKLVSSNKCSWFLSRNTDKKLSVFKLERSKCIEFDIKELKLGKNYFKNIIKKLKKINITSATKFIIDDKMKTKFSMDVFRREQDFLLLKYPREVGWFGRGTNTCLNESYLLFRYIKLRDFQLRCLSYFIEKINVGINNLSDVTNAYGVIKTTTSFPQYLNEWERYKKGEISSLELTDIIFPKHKIIE